MDDQLRVALNNLRPSDWDVFQDFASAFLLSDFPSLRPIGGTNDKGRDGVLFEPEPSQAARVVLQYSLVDDWANKIRKTVQRLSEKRIPCSVLIYATSRDIGSKSDAIEKELRDDGIALSIRDREWWVIRAGRDQATRHATQQLKSKVLGRILEAPHGRDGDADLTLPEVETGLFYLELHLRDADRDRNLTRVAFEAFVLASLAGTDAEHRKDEVAVLDGVGAEFPTQQRRRVDGLTRAALRRLKGERRITVSTSDGTYALHYAERQRLAELATQNVADQERLDLDLIEHIGRAAETLDYPEARLNKPLLANVLRRTFEEIATDYGNAFAEAVLRDSIDVPRTDVYDIVERFLINDAKTLSMLAMKQLDTFNFVTEAATQTLLSPAPAVVRFLHALSEAYTVRAFLRETPDIQEVVDKLFSRGVLTLDTTVLLPIFVETVLEASQQTYTNLLRGARAAGMSLVCTEGVFNEAATHLQNSVKCLRLGSAWRGPIPMVLDQWRVVHNGCGDFAKFVSDFLGSDPAGDVEDFLTQTLGIERRSFATEVDETFDLQTRARLTELWRERKRNTASGDVDLLLRHDVEMYLGVLALRQNQPPTVMGYEAWWVTLETNALALRGL